MPGQVVYGVISTFPSQLLFMIFRIKLTLQILPVAGL